MSAVNEMQTAASTGMGDPVPRLSFIASDIFRASRHASGHPLAIPRVSLTVDLCRALGWLEEGVYQEAPRARFEELTRFHTPDYVEAVARAEVQQWVSEEDRGRYNLGVNGNAIYPEMYCRPATACGASLLAARLLRAGGIVYTPAGGTHHGQMARASGYCIFNDPVLAILQMLEQEASAIVYLDLDAHFGDGVQDAFHDDDRVLTISIHEQGRWPMQPVQRPDYGSARDRAGGNARNFPVPTGFHDDELKFLMGEAILPLIQAAKPDAIVVQCGADALADDPMTKLALSNHALWGAVKAVVALAPSLLVLGGGGYNPYSVGRCWTGVWASLAGIEVPDCLPSAAQEVLQSVRWSHRLGRAPQRHWLDTLADKPRFGRIRDEVRALAAEI